MRISARARCTSSSRSISFNTSSSARRNPLFALVSTSGSVNSNPPEAVHHHCTLKHRLADTALWPVSLEPALDRIQELERGAAVEDAVVEGDLEIHHTAHADGVV